MVLNRTDSTLAMLSAIMRGGESVGCGAAHGFSDVRRELRAEITASLVFGPAEDDAVVMALVTSALFSGDPLTRTSLAFWVSGSLEMSSSSAEGVRTSAVTLCPRRSASSAT